MISPLPLRELDPAVPLFSVLDTFRLPVPGDAGADLLDGRDIGEGGGRRDDDEAKWVRGRVASGVLWVIVEAISIIGYCVFKAIYWFSEKIAYVWTRSQDVYLKV